MNRMTSFGGLVVLFVTAYLTIDARGVASGDEGGDLVVPGSVWKGEIRQGNEVYPGAIYFTERNKERIRGEIHFERFNEPLKLTFQGNVIDGQNVAWITSRKAGNVTSPGLYIGKIEGRSISGVWQVPSAGQYDSFTVKLVE